MTHVEFPCRHDRKRPPARPPAPRLTLFLTLAALAGPLHAMGLGEVTQQSSLGAPLRIVVPVLAGPGEELSGECFKLAPSQRGGDGIPELLTGRVALERVGNGARLVVTSLRGIDDPILKVTLQAGCGSAIRREYTLLMDPAPIEAPVARDAAAPRGAQTAPLPSAAIPAGNAERTAPVEGAAAATPPSAATQARAANAARRRAAASPRTEDAAPSRPATRSAPVPRAARKAPPVAAAQGPKLSVSAAPPAVEAPGKGAATPPKTDANPGVVAAPAKGAAAVAPPADAGKSAPTETPKAPAASAALPAGSEPLDAETAALRRRVEELTLMVDRMQQEMRVAEAQTARLAAETAARATPQAALLRWWNEGWPLLAAVIGLAALIAAGLTWRRNRATAEASPWRAEPAAPESAHRGLTVPVAVAAAAAHAAAADAPTPPARTAAPPQPVSTVDVSELSHVTEEAGVYLAFNRVDRAIEVLQEHISAKPRSIPAAWLMLLDLYRQQGREQEFRKLAEEFHLQFNAETPDWDAYARQEQGDRGLEAFPHLVRQLVDSWGKPDCRAFLEQLLYENRDGRRTGFSLAAYEDILFLRQLTDFATPDAPGAAPAEQRPRVPAAAAGAGTAPTAAAAVRAKRPVTLDLELALDNDMLDAARAQSPRSPPKPKGGA